MASETEVHCAAMESMQNVKLDNAKDKEQPKRTPAPFLSRNFNISNNMLGILRSIREPLAEYQERGGTPRDESYSFVPLITSLAQNAYSVTIAIFVMLASFAPMFEGFLFCIRFILDKLIEIFETDNTKDKVMKSLVFVGELAVIIIMTFLILSLIIFPVLQLTWKLFGKVWGMVWSSD